MTFFNLFRKQKNTNVETPVLDQDLADNIVDESLFVDKQTPAAEAATTPASAVAVFLGQDYQAKGYSDGYLFANATILDATLNQMRSAFRMAVDKEIDVKRSEVNELRQHLISAEGISERLDRQVKEKIQTLENLIAQLDQQKVLSIEDEGFVSTAVNDYRLGFQKGLEQYHAHKLLGGSCGLFNQ